MTDHIPAEVIEAAARAIQSAHVPVTGEEMPGWESESEAWRKTYRDFARAALEAALPFLRPEPSEDEQEALERLLYDTYQDAAGVANAGPAWLYEFARHYAGIILAAGFTRRPVPSREQVAQRIDKILDGDCGYGVGEHLADAVLALFEKGAEG